MLHTQKGAACLGSSDCVCRRIRADTVGLCANLCELHCALGSNTIQFILESHLGQSRSCSVQLRLLELARAVRSSGEELHASGLGKMGSGSVSRCCSLCFEHKFSSDLCYLSTQPHVPCSYALLALRLGPL